MNWRSLACLVLMSACAVEGGERTNGECPDGETCSDLTPEGLFFAAVPPSDYIGDLPGISVGGRQVVTLTPAGSYLLPEFAVDGGEYITVEQALRLDEDSGEATLIGGAAGPGLLRILAQDESGLLDRIRITVAEPANPRVRPYVGVGAEVLEGFDGEWRIYQDVQQLTLLAVLDDVAGERLVDLDLDFDSDAPMATGRPSSDRGWDVLPIQVTGLASVNVTIGSTTQVLEVTDKIDGFTEVNVGFDDGRRTLCFAGLDGATPVFGAPLMYRIDDDPTAQPLGGERADYPYQEWPCIAVIATAGPHQIHVSFGEIEETFDFVVGDGGSGSALRPSDAHAGAFGERASR